MPTFEPQCREKERFFANNTLQKVTPPPSQHDEVEQYVPDDLPEPFESSSQHNGLKRHLAAD